MSGFLNNEINNDYVVGMIRIVIDRLLFCSQIMKDECSTNASKIDNNEEKIRNRLVEKYLNNDSLNDSMKWTDIPLRYDIESPESFQESSDTYIGRTDIKVKSRNYFNDINDYLTIECKRIDGTQLLNQKYINEGVARFVKPPIKYKSHRGENIMFGFVVNDTDMENNTTNIDLIQQTDLNDYVVSNFFLDKKSDKTYLVYSSKYKLLESQLKLNHLFFNFATAINLC